MLEKRGIPFTYREYRSQPLTEDELRRLFDVAPGSFRPQPRVRSTVVTLEPRQQDRLPDCCLAIHDQLVRAAFAQRRKTLANNLKAQSVFDFNELIDLIRGEGIDPGCRADSLEVARYASLARKLCPSHPSDSAT